MAHKLPLTVGPAVSAPYPAPSEFIMWDIYRAGKTTYRVYAGLLGRTMYKVTFADVAQAFDAPVRFASGRVKYVGRFLEPCYDHNGYFDPPGGGPFTEAEYQAYLKKLKIKIGKLPVYAVKCASCKTTHTRPVKTCRECQSPMK